MDYGNLSLEDRSSLEDNGQAQDGSLTGRRAMPRLAPLIAASCQAGLSRLLHGSEGRVEPTEAPVAVAVVPLRLDSTPRSDAADNRVVGIREDAGANACEERRADRRALLRVGRLER